jgi:hypothetical protein
VVENICFAVGRLQLDMYGYDHRCVFYADSLSIIPPERKDFHGHAS